MPEFNFKSPVVTRKVRETEIIQSFYERRGYAQISTDLLNYITNNVKSVVIVKLICYIAKTIKFNSNKIILKENDETKKICSFIHLHRYIKKLVLCLMLMVELFLINL